MPAVVSAGVPRRRPLVTNGERGSGCKHLAFEDEVSIYLTEGTQGLRRFRREMGRNREGLTRAPHTETL